jgi:hypothetical protein
MIRVMFAPKEVDPIGTGQIVKADEELWVPHNLLRSSSQFLQAATKPEWDAVREDKCTVTLKTDPMLFKAYVSSFSVFRPARMLSLRRFIGCT